MWLVGRAHRGRQPVGCRWRNRGVGHDRASRAGRGAGRAVGERPRSVCCAVGGAIEVGGSPGETTVPPDRRRLVRRDCRMGLDDHVGRRFRRAARRRVRFRPVRRAPVRRQRSRRVAARRRRRCTALTCASRISAVSAVTASRPNSMVPTWPSRPCRSSVSVSGSATDPTKAWFAEHPGACDAHMSSAEKKFSGIGDR